MRADYETLSLLTLNSQQFVDNSVQFFGLERTELGMRNPALAIDNNGKGQCRKLVAQRFRQFHRTVAADERGVIEPELLGKLLDLVGLVDSDAHKLQAPSAVFVLGAHEFRHLF